MIEVSGLERRSANNKRVSLVDKWSSNVENLSMKKINQILGNSIVDVKHGDEISDIDIILGLGNEMK